MAPASRLTDTPHDLRQAEASWGGSGGRMLFSAGDVRNVLRRFPLAVSLARASIRDPRTLGIVATAIRRHRALQKPLELFEYLRYLRPRGVVRSMEIGTLWGGTFFAHCAVTAPHGHMIAVDAFPHESAAEMSARFRRLAHPHQRVTCLWSDSHAASTRAAVATALDGAPLDVLFLDGDHTYAGVTRDYEMYAPLVRPGGVIAFHDIAATGSCGVPALWRSLRERHESVEFIDRVHAPHGLGIGAIVKG